MAGVVQGLEITRERTVKGKTTVEVEYGMTSLKPDEADAKRLSDLVREHWRIENELHYVRDVTLGEDACRVRKGSAPRYWPRCATPSSTSWADWARPATLPPSVDSTLAPKRRSPFSISRRLNNRMALSGRRRGGKAS